MIATIALASIAIFVVALWLFGVVRIAIRVLNTTRAAVAAMRDQGLDDDTREKVVQRASGQLFGAFVSITFRSVLAGLASLAPIWLAKQAGLASIDDVMMFLSRWQTILIATIAITLGLVIKVLLWPSKRTSPP